MTEFPALRDALVRAALRRRRRRRAIGAAVPAVAACVGAIALLALPGTPEDRERVARPPAGVLERNYAAFRRPRTAADVLPGAAASRSRLIARDGEVRLFAVPSADGRTICLTSVPGGRGCGPVDPDRAADLQRRAGLRGAGPRWLA